MIWEIVILGTVVACACALLGNFLVLRRMSMMGDAISHAVLPGIVVAYLLLGSRNSLPMLLGAVTAGVLTTLLIQWLHKRARVEESTSMGVVFTSLFALGIYLVTREAGHVDLDLDCVLYGSLEVLAYDLFSPTFWMLIAVLGINALFVILLFKELTLTSFDPQLSDTLGFSSSRMHQVLMALVAITTVASFEAVGSILVIAMLVVPAATARMFTDRLGVQIGLSLGFAVLCAWIGHAAAIYVPRGFGATDTITSGMMATCSGLMYVAAVFFAPRHGILSKGRHRRSMQERLVREDILGILYRLREIEKPSNASVLSQVLGYSSDQLKRALEQLRRGGQVLEAAGQLELTEAGAAAGRNLIQSHRLWESYFAKHFDLPLDHLHEPAEKLEHITDLELMDRLRREVDDPDHDPMGKEIPR